MRGLVVGGNLVQVLAAFPVAALSTVVALSVRYRGEGRIFGSRRCRLRTLGIIGTTAAVCALAGVGVPAAAESVQPWYVALVAPGALGLRRKQGADNALDIDRRYRNFLTEVVTAGIVLQLELLEGEMCEDRELWCASRINTSWTIGQLKNVGMHYYRLLGGRVKGNRTRSSRLEKRMEEFQRWVGETTRSQGADAKWAHFKAEEILLEILRDAYRWGYHRWPPYEPPHRR